MENQPFQSYQIHISITENINITVGKLGTFQFPAGTYIYTGSARKNMAARIRRHLSQSKTLKWHIDYLLTHPCVHIVDVKRFCEDECDVNQHTMGDILIPRFGSSDCKNGCGSHLKYKEKQQ